jgi:hypothetical protein
MRIPHSLPTAAAAALAVLLLAACGSIAPTVTPAPNDPASPTTPAGPSSPGQTGGGAAPPDAGAGGTTVPVPPPAPDPAPATPPPGSDPPPATTTPADAADVSWSAPTQRTDGTPLTNLAGFRVYYGLDAANLDRAVDVADAALTSARVAALEPGTWYFAVTAVDADGVESAPAGPVSKVVR